MTMNLKQMKTTKSLKRIHIVENKIEIRMRDLAEKWKHSNREVSDACRDAAEELRVLRLQLEAANRELELYRSLSRPHYYPNIPEQEYKITCDTNVLGWGKGKDE